MKCPQCGKEIRDGAKFCNSCGILIKGIPEKKKGIEKKGSQTLRITLSIFFVILLIGFGGMIAYMAGTFEGFLHKDSDVVMVETERDEKEDDTETGLSGESFTTLQETPTIEERTAVESITAETAGLPTQVPTSAQPIVAESNLMTSAAPMPTVAYEPSATAPAAQGSVLNSDYILPDSSSRLLSVNEVSGMSKDQLKLARNEIYARHGRLFKDDVIQSYFNAQIWYRGTVNPESFSDNLLSQVEKDNIKLIQQYESNAR